MREACALSLIFRVREIVRTLFASTFQPTTRALYAIITVSLTCLEGYLLVSLLWFSVLFAPLVDEFRYFGFHNIEEGWASVARPVNFIQYKYYTKF